MCSRGGRALRDCELSWLRRTCTPLLEIFAFVVDPIHVNHFTKYVARGKKPAFDSVIRVVVTERTTATDQREVGVGCQVVLYGIDCPAVAQAITWIRFATAQREGTDDFVRFNEMQYPREIVNHKLAQIRVASIPEAIARLTEKLKYQRPLALGCEGGAPIARLVQSGEVHGRIVDINPRVLADLRPVNHE